MNPFRYKPGAPHGSPDYDGESEPGKSFEELQDEYYDCLDNGMKEER